VSAPLELGETYQYRHTVTDIAGIPANAGTVAVTITLPDGTTATPSVVPNGTGIYDFDYLTTQVGRHTLLGSATGGTLGSATEKFDDTFNVEQPGRFLVGFDDARTQLRAVSTITTLADREQLRWLCLAASDAVERDLGRVVARRTVVETYDGGITALVLRSTPVISITTVVEDDITLTANDYVLRKRGWLLQRGTTKSQRYWADGWENITVTSVAGMINPPAVVRLVALYLVQALWQSSQQAPHPLLDEGGAEEANVFAGALLTGLPQPLKNAYASLRSAGTA
jgi:hypothetical protein